MKSLFKELDDYDYFLFKNMEQISLKKARVKLNISTTRLNLLIIGQNLLLE